MSTDNPQWENLPIHYLVLETKNFIVFIDPEIDVDWKTTEEYDEQGANNIEEHNAVLIKMACIECIPNSHQKEDIRLNFKRMIGEALARSLEHDYDNAKTMLNEACTYITKRNIELARFWQSLTILIAIFICCLSVLVIWYFREWAILHIQVSALFFILSGLFGAVGAGLSVLQRLGHLKVTSEAEKNLHICEAISKIVVGAISGLLISILIKIGIIFPLFQSVNSTYLAMIAGALLAGASERLVPSLIEQFEKHDFNSKSAKEEK